MEFPRTELLPRHTPGDSVGPRVQPRTAPSTLEGWEGRGGVLGTATTPLRQTRSRYDDGDDDGFLSPNNRDAVTTRFGCGTPKRDAAFRWFRHDDDKIKSQRERISE